MNTNDKQHSQSNPVLSMNKRFRGYMPVVVDVETAGLVSKTDALLEIAVVLIHMDENGILHPGKSHHAHIIPFQGANLDPKSLAFNKIDPYHPFRFAVNESEALNHVFKPIHEMLKQTQCQRALLVGHNAWFDLAFVNAAIARCKLKQNPFHAFTSIDTASLSALLYGQTVLSKTLHLAKIEFDSTKAHSAKYDAQVTAELFCKIVNMSKDLFEGTL